MTLVLVATSMAANANAYATEAEVTAILEGRPNSSAWTVATQPTREQAIVGATMRLEQESYVGTRTTSGQALKWPRLGVLDDDGYEVSSTVIPPQVQRAVADLALALVVKPGALDLSGLAQFEDVTVGPLSLTTRASALWPNSLPASVMGFLRGLMQGGQGMTRLVRG